jgi:hypothetical protein
MKRTSIYLDPDLEVLLKLEAMRSKRSMADILRRPRQKPPVLPE